MRLWRKPLQAVIDAFTTAGFGMSVISEPQPDPALRALFPDGFDDSSTKPCFLFFVVETLPSANRLDLPTAGPPLLGVSGGCIPPPSLLSTSQVRPS